jgi:hypothetical protein
MENKPKILWKNAQIAHSRGLGTGFRFVTRYCDLLVAPWLLDAAMLSLYLFARGASLCIPAALSMLGRKAAPQLRDMARATGQSRFQAAAARVNLGYMMICGAMALIVIGLTPLLLEMLQQADPEFSEILIWLVIGQSAPVFFGATGLLMHALDRAAFNDLLHGVTMLFFLLGIFTVTAQETVPIAQTFAAAQLAHGAICAVLLTQSGVWPGLTALFHKEIKLF